MRPTQADDHAEEEATEKEEGEEGDEEAEEDDTPKPDFKPPPVVPKEDKAGPNKKTYFVCNDRKLIMSTFIFQVEGVPFRLSEE